MESTIRLFKAVPIETRAAKHTDIRLSETITRGFILAPEVAAAYPDTSHIVKLIDAAYGRNPHELNQSFHKSWAKVRDTPIEQLVVEQIVHYITTYGFEQLGVYSSESVYIPREQLDAPALKDDVRLVVIKGYTKDELLAKLFELIGSGVALGEQSVADALDVAMFVGLTADDADKVRNKEVKAALYDYWGIVPNEPVEFLRYLVYRATGQTLLIKSPVLIAELAGRTNADLVRYFDMYEKQVGLASLAEVFYRFKPIFLAMRTNSILRKKINRIRRLATVYHKPMQPNLLNDATAHLKRGTLSLNALKEELRNANTFRKSRLAYALQFRTTEAESIVYRVRNGRSWATGFEFHSHEGAAQAYEIVKRSIVKDLKRTINGKTVYIPRGVHYGLPSTERQFTGNLPSGTYVEVPKDMVVGVHWKNVDDHRIDLDLSLVDANEKIGWDGRYRSNGVLFSGDMTDASGAGASELFYIGRDVRGAWIMPVNYFNLNRDVPVPFKIVVGRQKPVNPTRHYTIDPNKVVAQTDTVMSVYQKTLGIIVATDAHTRFYFAESNLGAGRTSYSGGPTEQARQYLLHYYTNAISLNDLLREAGAEFVDEPTDASVDLSMEIIDRTSLIALLRGAE